MKRLLLIFVTLLTIGVSRASATTYTVTYSNSTGSYTATNAAGTWASAWKSTATNPYVTLTTTANNIKVTDGGIYSGSVGCTYTLTAQDGYAITGYTITGTANTSAQTLTPAAGGSETSFATTGTTTLTVSGLYLQSTSFTHSTPNNGIQISSFTITVAPAYTVTYNIKDADSNLWASFEQEVAEGTEITDLPALYKRAYCSYSMTSTTITGDTEIDVTCTYSGPTNLVFASDVADATANNKWMELKRSNNTNYVYYNGSTLAYTATDLSTADGYQWAVIGNPYSYKLYNKGAQGYLSASVPTTNTDTRNDFTFNSTGLDFELFKYKQRAANDHFVSVVKGTNTNEHTGTVLNEAGGEWKIWCGKDNSGFECYNGLMNGLSASLLLTFAVPTTFSVTYIVQDGSGNELDRAVAEVEAEDDGDAASDHMPSSLVKTGCTYTYSPTTVSEDAEITVTYTYGLGCGFNVYEDYSDITTWYFLKRNNTDYLVYDSESTPNIQRSTSLPDGDNASWAFVGNPYEGFKVYNKGAGSSVWMVSDTPSTSDEGEAATVSLASSGDVQSWFLSTSGYFTNGFFIANNDNYKLNGRQSQTTICYWTGGADGGSTFVTIENVDYSSNVTSEFASWFTTNVGKYFALSQATYDAQNTNYTAYASSATYKQYMELKAAVEAGIRFPAAGYYRIKNKLTTDSYGYMGLSGEQLSGNLSNTNDASTIIHLTKNGDKYYFQTQGKYTSNVRKDNAVNLSVSAPSEAFALTVYSPGYGCIRTYADGDYSYYHVASTKDYKIVGWESSADASQWVFEDATDLTLSLNAVGSFTYGTTYLPFDVTLPAANATGGDVCAYTLTDLGNGWVRPVLLGSDGKSIPAGTAVLISGTSSTSVTATIEDVDDIDEGDNLLSGTYVSIAPEDNLVLGKIDGVAGFYKYDYNIKPNKAFIPAALAPGIKGFIMDFDDMPTGINGIANGQANGSGAIYNIAGQRVANPVRGLYIVNGKKVMVK